MKLIPAVFGLASFASVLPATAEAPSLDWVALNSTCFQMGETRIYPEEAPRREACVDALEITRTEITYAQYSAFVEATGYVTRAERGWSADEPNGPGVALPPGSARQLYIVVSASFMVSRLMCAVVGKNAFHKSFQSNF